MDNFNLLESEEETVAKFAELLNPFLHSAVNPLSVIEVVANFYRNFRIAGTSLEDSDDMLLLEWGTNRPFRFTGFRYLLGDVDMEHSERQWLGLTRQIFFPPTEEDMEFGAGAIQLCAHLYFEESSGKSTPSALWVSHPDELDDQIAEFLENPFVASLVASPPTLLNAFVTVTE